jgi:hypothetical protein
MPMGGAFGGVSSFIQSKFFKTIFFFSLDGCSTTHHVATTTASISGVD